LEPEIERRRERNTGILRCAQNDKRQEAAQNDKRQEAAQNDKRQE
jgi:hypothetical protein